MKNKVICFLVFIVGLIIVCTIFDGKEGLGEEESIIIPDTEPVITPMPEPTPIEPIPVEPIPVEPMSQLSQLSQLSQVMVVVAVVADIDLVMVEDIDLDQVIDLEGIHSGDFIDHGGLLEDHHIIPLIIKLLK